MKTTPKVSVIIPVYNRAATIGRAIQSVLTQTFDEYEIIVVDDGSTDRTGAIVKNIKDPRIKLIAHDRNRYAPAARNTGMRAAMGKYIAWLDSDDEWFPEKLSAQVDALEKVDSDVKACYVACERFDGERAYVHIPRSNEIKKMYLSCDLGPGTTLMFERAILAEIGYLDENLPRYEDMEWIIRYLARYRLKGIDLPLARIHKTSVASANVVEESALALIAKIEPGLRAYGLFRRIAISWRWMDVASYYALEHNLFGMFKYILKALVVYPLQPLEAWSWILNHWFNIKVGRWFQKTAKKRREMIN